MESPLDVERRQLRQLRAEIAQAERTLEHLRTAVAEVRSEGGLAQMAEILAENQRLAAKSSRDNDEVDHAHAALDAAIKSAETDPLTLLPNRIVLWDRLAHDIAFAKRHGTLVAVYFLDLDNLKKVNDELGHAIGDQLLQLAARRLCATLRASDTVCRIGGDEFVLVAPELQQRDAQEVCSKIQSALGTPCALGGHMLTPSASIGFSVYPVDGEEPETLVRKADAAMYRCKKLRHAGDMYPDGAYVDPADPPARPA